ncbi:MAG: hypothetical protein ABSD88_02350 [Candidatus Korobacteraceae bacterium]|jgi:hypothetical protein
MSTGRPFTKQRLRGCLDHDEYRLHPLVWARLRELHIDLSDALHVLRHGMIYAEPEFDAKIGQWRFTVQGKTVDSNELSIVFTFVEIDGVLILSISNEGP